MTLALGESAWDYSNPDEDDRIQTAADAVIASYPSGINPFAAADRLAAMDALRDAGIPDVFERPELPRIIFAAIADKAELLRGEI